MCVDVFINFSTGVFWYVFVVSTNYTYLEDSCESSYDVTDTCGREFDATDTCHGRYDTTGTSGSGYDNTGTSGSGYDATDTCGSDYDGTDTCDGGYDVGNTSESELLDKLETCQDKNDSKSCNKTGLSGVKPIPRMSLCRILVINLPWFGLALMYLILTVEGELISFINLPNFTKIKFDFCYY